MDVRPLGIPQAWVVDPVVHADSRGEFLELFRGDLLAEATGRRLDTVQVNLSTSPRGTVRGLHYADVPPGQAKYVTAVAGSVLDVLVDLRVGSPTFGHVEYIELDAGTHRAVFVPEGVGHLFAVTSEHATVCYLASDIYRPESEHPISPLDPAIGILLPEIGEPILSPRDSQAPTLAAALESGLLPSWDACQARYAALAE
ncbi:dTDP-4-dehydrorhamnose 3,5-epimerase [soil metagenome]